MKIVFGTWQMGEASESDPNNDDERDIAAMKYAIDMGLNHIDTAESYANGKCEIVVGEAIKCFPREKLFITTKARDTKLGYADLIKSCKESLSRLGLDYVDL